MTKKIVIITGISRGLGSALVTASEMRGLTVIGIGRTKPESFNGDFYQCDLSIIKETERVSSELFNELSKQKEVSSIYLINNAATASPVGKIGSLDTKEICESLDLNLISPLLLINQFCKYLATLEVEKRIINISSGAATQAVPGLSIYSVAKAGLDSVTKAVADEYLQERICVLSVHPGVIDTDMQEYLRSQSKKKLPSRDLFKDFQEEDLLNSPEFVAKTIVSKYLLGDVYAGKVYHTEFAPNFFSRLFNHFKS